MPPDDADSSTLDAGGREPERSVPGRTATGEGELAHPEATLFQGFWHGPPLGALRQACLRSFIECGHRFHLYTYGPVDVPVGVELMDANQVIPLESIFYYRNPQTGTDDLGPFSDLFRFRLLGMRGGWWSDVDTVCLSPDIPNVETAWACEFPEIRPRGVGTSQIALAEGSDLADSLYRECLALSRVDMEQREALGPLLLSRTLEARGLPPDNFGDADMFYPIRWLEAFKLWLPEFRDEVSRRTAGAMFLPLFQTLARYQGVDLSRLPPAGSYLDQVRTPLGDADDAPLRQSAAAIVAGVREYFGKNDWALPTMRAVAGGDTTLRALGLG